MANILFVKVDVSRIDKKRLFDGKNGAKYLDLVCIPSDGKYGDTHFVTQSCSKEERAAGLKMPIIGNVKEQGGRQEDSRRQEPRRSDPPPRQPSKPAPAENPDDIPF